MQASFNSYFQNLFVSLCCIFHIGFLYPQSEYIGTDNNLSNRDVTTILQTKNSYIWFGTKNGLNRYDGYEIKVLLHSPDNKNCIAGNNVNFLYEDEAEKLWIGTDNGLSILDQKTDRFKTLNIPDSNSKGLAITCYRPLHDGSVLLGTGNGKVYKIKPSGFCDLFVDTKFEFSRISGIHIDDNSSVWVVIGHSKIYKYNASGMQDSTIDLSWFDEVRSIHTVGLFDIGGLFLNHNLLKFSIDNGILIHDDFLDSINKIYRQPTAVLINSPSEVWIGFTSGNLLKINFVERSLVDYSEYVKKHLTSAIRSIYKDRGGLIWIGSNFGIVKFMPGNNIFETFLNIKGDEALYNKHSIREIIEDEDGNIYTGGYSGLYKYHPESKALARIPMKGNNGKVNIDYSTFCLLNDTSGFIWIGSEGVSFSRYNKKTGLFDNPAQNNPENKKYLPPIYKLIRDFDGTILLGSSEGVLRYDPSTNNVTQFFNSSDGNTKFEIPSNEVIDIILEENGYMWIGTYGNGLQYAHRDSGIIKSYSTSGVPSLSHNVITDLYLTEDSVLWIGTRGGGLNGLDLRTKEIVNYNISDGLADNLIAGIEEQNGKLIISTFNGLSIFDPRNGVFENYFEKDGITDNEFNIASHLKSSDGSFYFGGMNGVNVFKIDDLRKKKPVPPEIFITKISRHYGDSNRVTDISIDFSTFNSVKLSSKDKFISFHFALSDYFNPNKNRFYYKLEGFNDSWINLGFGNNVRFNDLDPGNYKLLIRGVNAEGINTSNIIAVDLMVEYPIYRRTWFILLAISITILFVYFIMKYRYLQRLKIQKLRTKISSDLHDEVGSILTRISVQAELMKQGLIEKENGKIELDKIAGASRLATSTMNDVLWSIDARNDSMGSLIDHMREFLFEILDSGKFEVIFNTHGIDLDREIKTDIRQNLFLIFKEAITNIVKHSNADKVEINLENKGKEFFMKIMDNGSNSEFKREKSGNGQGLKNMKMRAENICGKLLLETGHGFHVIFSRKIFC